MRIPQAFPVVTLALLLGFGAGSAQAGSFFGPYCYGADYTYKYPNRSHNVFGCGPGCHCRACHPFFWHGLFRRNQGMAMNQSMPSNAMPPVGTPQLHGMPINSSPIPPVAPPAVQSAEPSLHPPF